MHGQKHVLFSCQMVKWIHHHRPWQTLSLPQVRPIRHLSLERLKVVEKIFGSPAPFRPPLTLSFGHEQVLHQVIAERREARAAAMEADHRVFQLDQGQDPLDNAIYGSETILAFLQTKLESKTEYVEV